MLPSFPVSHNPVLVISFTGLNNINSMGATSGAGIAFPSRISAFTSGGVRVVGSLVLMYTVLCIIVCLLYVVSFGHYIVCPLIYGSNDLFILSTASVA